MPVEPPGFKRQRSDEDLGGEVPGRSSGDPPHVTAIESYLNTMPDLEEKYWARRVELEKLSEFGAFKLVPTAAARGKPLYHFTWVETVKDGGAKARFTVADVKTEKGIAGFRGDCFSPTPSAAAGRIFEAYALKTGNWTQTGDVIAAYPHAAETEECYVRCPKEFLQAMCEQIQAGQRHDYKEEDLQKADQWVLKLEANVYGRRPAGNKWRKHFEEVLLATSLTQFRRLDHEPCMFLCDITGVLVLHHVDDFRVCGGEREMQNVVQYLQRQFWVKLGPVEKPGVESKFLGKPRYGPRTASSRFRTRS